MRLTPDRSGAAVCSVMVDGQDRLATGSGTGMVRLWDPATGEPLHTLESYSGGVRAVCSVVVEGQTLLAIGSGAPLTGRTRRLLPGYERGAGTVELREPPTLRAVRTFESYVGAVRAVCSVVVDGRTLIATGSDNRTIRLWDPETGKPRRARRRLGKSFIPLLPPRRKRVWAMCSVVVDGRTLLALGSDDRMVRLWNPVTGQTVRTLDSRAGGVRAVCPVPVEDGRTLLATGGDDRTIRLWNPSTGKSMLTIPIRHVVLSAMSIGASLIIGLDMGVVAIHIDLA